MKWNIKKWRPYVPMKDVAVRQGVSLKYLEQILPLLKQQNLVVGIQGKGVSKRMG